MFLLVFVILFKEGIGFPACITGHMTSIQGDSAHRVCIQGEGLHLGESASWGGGGGGSAYRGSASRGVGQTPPHPTRTRKMGGAHPTGMFS